MNKPLVITIIALFLLGPVIGPAHALYTVVLPTNTVYADDFENYAAGQKIGCSTSSGGVSNDGWGWIDCDTGGSSNITTTNYYSPSHSMIVTSPNAGAGIFDVDKRFFLSNSTTLLSISIWWAVSNSYKNQAFNNHHISIETWGVNSSGIGARYEAPIFYYSRLSGTGSCTLNSGVEIDAIGATSLGLGGSDHVSNNYCLPVYSTSTNRKAVWHHQVTVLNVKNKQWKNLEVDGIDLTSLVCPTTCLYMSNHGAGVGNQNGDDQQYTGPGASAGFAPPAWRFEVGSVNGATHNLPADTWYAWTDDVIISDVTSGQQPNIIQFAIGNANILFLGFLGLIGILYYLRIGDRLLSRKASRGLFGNKPSYPHEQPTTAEQEAKNMTKVIIIILILSAILAAMGLFIARII